MAGIYIHIPFCTKICHYCDFYKTGNVKLISEFVEVLLKEIEFRKYFIVDKVTTVYFGGGTPSVLSIHDLERILNKLNQYFNISSDAEITIEVNPDDVSFEYYNQLQSIGFNRLSIGIQSFNNNILKFLNRRHNSESALKSIELALSSGFKRISCDLIYGIPGQELHDFEEDLGIICTFGITHLSAYHLGIEDGTYFGKLKSQGKLSEINEESSNGFYKLLINWAASNGYDQYEVSNFARNEHFSNHNMNYWFNVPYLGLGPSAHSYDGTNRFFNNQKISNFLDFKESSNFAHEIDILNEVDKFNEFILLRLRTKWGLDLNSIKVGFPELFYKHILFTMSKLKQSNYLRVENGFLFLTHEGFFVSDYIIREFFIIK